MKVKREWTQTECALAALAIWMIVGVTSMAVHYLVR